MGTFPNLGATIVVCAHHAHRVWVQRLQAAVATACQPRRGPIITTYFTVLPTVSLVEAKIVVMDPDHGCDELIVDLASHDAVDGVVEWLFHPNTSALHGC